MTRTLAALAVRVPPLRPLLFAVIAGVAAAAVLTKVKGARPRRLVRVEPRVRPETGDVPWGREAA